MFTAVMLEGAARFLIFKLRTSDLNSHHEMLQLDYDLSYLLNITEKLY